MFSSTLLLPAFAAAAFAQSSSFAFFRGPDAVQEGLAASVMAVKDGSTTFGVACTSGDPSTCIKSVTVSPLAPV